MEAGDPSVSLDLLVRSLLILGESRKGLAKILSQPHSVFLRTLEETQGAWNDKNHPDLKTARDMEKFVADKRQSCRRRLKRITHATSSSSPITQSTTPSPR